LPDQQEQLHPQLRLDELLSQLQDQIASQVGAIVATRDRLHGLLDAVVAVGGDLELPVLLRRLTEAAVQLVDAEYGALGMVVDGRLAEFITVGIDEEQRERIGHLPEGLGLLGLLIKDPVPLRLPNLAEHHASFGFPPGHPPMTTFLGVPVRVRGAIFGNLYLTNKRHGQQFTEEDEALVQALASAAGVAIENARLFEQAVRRDSWLTASSEVTTALLSGIDPTEALALIANHARALASAELATIAIPTADGLLVEVADGDEAALVLGRRLDLEHSLAGRAFLSRITLNVPDATADARAAGAAPGQSTYGPTLIVPLQAGETRHGVLTVSNSPTGVGFDKSHETLVETFAGQASVALELAGVRRAADRLQVFEDRDRIARDLHDLVIQRLFASGMRLESLSAVLTDKDHLERVRLVVDELDETIREIRSTIYALQSANQNNTVGLRRRLLSVADSASVSLGFAPSIKFDGPLDTTVPANIADQLVAVLVEALSNVARHSQAHHVTVVVTVSGQAITMMVSDDGIGMPADQHRRSGLANLAERAHELGGSFELRTPDVGLVLVWSVPLSGPNG
jgi:signal transduction histidine kinase